MRTAWVGESGSRISMHSRIPIWVISVAVGLRLSAPCQRHRGWSEVATSGWWNSIKAQCMDANTAVAVVAVLSIMMSRLLSPGHSRCVVPH